MLFKDTFCYEYVKIQMYVYYAWFGQINMRTQKGYIFLNAFGG